MVKLFSIFVFLFFEFSFSKIIFVSKQNEIKTIKMGIENCNPNDTIILKHGIYKEQIIEINKPIVIIGENWPTIDGENKYEIFQIKSDDVVLQNLHFKNSGISYLRDNAAVRIEGVKNCLIKNNKFTNNYFGIYFSKSSNCVATDNKIISNGKLETSSGNGIHQWYCKEIKVENNFISGHRDGIYLEFSRRSLIKNNTSKKNIRYGLHFMYSDSCRYYSNDFSSNGAGVAVMYSNEIEMVKNKFTNNWGASSFGLLLKDIKNSYIALNEIYKNSIGIHIEASSRLKIEKNIFKDNGWGIKLMANSTENLITKNNFFSNTFDVSTNSRLNYNNFENNYWDNYKGYDLSNDKIGDVPYRPVSLFSVIVSSTPPALILMKSYFMDFLNISEKIIPTLTPTDLVDKNPSMLSIKVNDDD